VVVLLAWPQLVLLPGSVACASSAAVAAALCAPAQTVVVCAQSQALSVTDSLRLQALQIDCYAARTMSMTNHKIVTLKDFGSTSILSFEE
jgi:hypothetical protein